MKRRPSRNASFYIIFSCFVSHSPCAILTAGILILMVTFVDLLRGGSHDLSSPSINEIIPFLEGPGRKRFRSVVECPVVFLTRHDESLLSREYFLRFSHVFPGGWQKRGRRGPRLKEFPPSSTVNSTIVNAFCPPPPHLRPAVSVRLNESIRRFFTCFVSPRTTFPLTSDFSPLPSFLPSFPSLFLFLCNLQRSILTLETPLDALIFSLSFYLIRIVYLDRIPVYHDPRPVYLPSDRLVHLAATTTELTVGRDAPLRQLMFVLIVFLCWCSAPRVRESQTIRRHTSTGTYTRRVTHLDV